MRCTYLQHEAEVSGSSVSLFVFVGGVDVDFVKTDKADQVTGGLEQRNILQLRRHW